MTLDEQNSQEDPAEDMSDASQAAPLDSHHSGEQIIAGARNEDQLGKFMDTAAEEGGSDSHESKIGASPGTRDQGDGGKQDTATGGSYEELEENLGGTTNLSLDQLMDEGDPAGDR